MTEKIMIEPIEKIKKDSSRNIYSKEYTESIKCSINDGKVKGLEDAIYKLFYLGLYSDKKNAENNSRKSYKITSIQIIGHSFYNEKLEEFLKLYRMKLFDEDKELEKRFKELSENSQSDDTMPSEGYKSGNSLGKYKNKKSTEEHNSLSTFLSFKDLKPKESEIEIDCVFWNVEGEKLKNIMKKHLESDGIGIEDNKKYVLFIEICLNLSTQWVEKLKQMEKILRLILYLKEIHPQENFLFILISNSERISFINQIDQLKSHFESLRKKLDGYILFFPLYFETELLRKREIDELKENIILQEEKIKSQEEKIKTQEEKIQNLEQQLETQHQAQLKKEAEFNFHCQELKKRIDIMSKQIEILLPRKSSDV